MSEIAQTADHALRILEELGKGEPLSPTELCQRLDLNRTVVHRLLKTLAARGFVLRQGVNYRPGAALVRIASTIEPDLRAVAVPIMSKVAHDAGETVVLHVVDGAQAVVLGEAVATEHVVQVRHRIGSRHPLNSGASGRAILAFLPTETAAKIVRNADDPERVAEDLKAIRSHGYALSHDELQMGVHGIAVPVLGVNGVAIGSLAILTPVNRAHGLERHVDGLQSASAQIQSEYHQYVG
ncbi:IclR family transcriptional regulator [Nonomuraea sp. NPDC026600]|uniref:IclR family transcriptional regulator n=1 Tax=Nonomuraea sp. NPDC026600 TaxID=3155363 RepID=UPI003411872C